MRTTSTAWAAGLCACLLLLSGSQAFGLAPLPIVRAGSLQGYQRMAGSKSHFDIQ